MSSYRSECPINLTLEALGDRWTLLVLRDLMFSDRRSYGELLSGSEERIASNILADRLKKLVEGGFVVRAEDPGHRQKGIFTLTEKAIQLLPLLAQMGAWGRRFTPAGHALSVRARILEEGGPALWAEFMDELRSEHLGTGTDAPRTEVAERLRTAYETALSEPA